MAKGWGRFRWLDYRALIERFVLDGQSLEFVKYFTTRVTHQPKSLARQDNYLLALAHRGGIEIIPGVFEKRQVQCQSECGRWYRRPQEKRTDVNIATHLVSDAYEDRFDTFILICADSDLVPAADHLIRRHGKRMILIDPPRRHSDELAELAHAHLRVSSSRLNQSQLPDPVEIPKRKGTRRIYKPDTWV